MPAAIGTPVLATTTTDAATAAAATCDVCGHLVSAHDRVATRYCDATLNNALARGCLCR